MIYRDEFLRKNNIKNMSIIYNATFGNRFLITNKDNSEYYYKIDKSFSVMNDSINNIIKSHFKNIRKEKLEKLNKI
jgi:hypothetical protein